MEKKLVSKKHAATAQIETAIKLYFENRDLVSAYTLSAAADGILEGVWKNERETILKRQFDEGKNSSEIRFSCGEEMEIRLKDEHKKAGFKLIRATRNFFKHAKDDHDQEHQFASVDETGLQIFLAIVDYRLVFTSSTRAMDVFQLWYLMLHPNFMTDDNPILPVLKAGPYGLEVAKHLDHAELAAMGYENLQRDCPELFPPTDLQSHLRGIKTGKTIRLPTSPDRKQ